MSVVQRLDLHEVEVRVVALVSKQLGVQPSLVTLTSRLVEDLVPSPV